jgi:hypothetical protein
VRCIALGGDAAGAGLGHDGASEAQVRALGKLGQRAHWNRCIDDSIKPLGACRAQTEHLFDQRFGLPGVAGMGFDEDLPVVNQQAGIFGLELLDLKLAVSLDQF